MLFYYNTLSYFYICLWGSVAVAYVLEFLTVDVRKNFIRMKMSKILSLFALCLLIFSCSTNYYIRKGDKLYDTGRFYKSCDYYRTAYAKIKSEEEKSGMAQKIGMAYEKVNKLKKASLWYGKALRYRENDSDLLYELIEIAHKAGDTKKVNEYLARYEELTGESPEVLKNYMQNLCIADSRYSISDFKKINRISGEFSPVYHPGDTNVIYFTSTRGRMEKQKSFGGLFSKGVKKDEVTGAYYSNIYSIRFTDEVKYKDKKGNEKIRHLKKAKWMRPVLLNDTLINSMANEGSICFSPDGNTMYFTSSRELAGVSKGTKIYTVKRKGDGWGDLGILNIVPDSISVGHPALSPDGTRLYFVSDMQPGRGGKDIWYCEKESGNWSKPINAGRLINTEGDELYPYFRDNGQFYFSSTGHSGLGGLDIFRLDVVKGEYIISNLGYPFNSVADDFGICYKEGLNEGLFTSSRGKRGDDNILKFKYIPCVHSLKIVTKNYADGKLMDGVGIKIVSKSGDEQKLRIYKSKGLVIDLNENEDYLVVLNKPGFLKEKFTISTKGLKKSKVFEKELVLKSIEKPIELPNILYETGKWNLKEESKESLDDLVKTLNENPELVIELSSHTDMVGSDKDNIMLSQKRAQSVVNYLIEKGINWDRLVAKGYGETVPKEVNNADANNYKFLNIGQFLTKEFLLGLSKEYQEKCNQLNRRTEFKVLRTDYKPGPDSEKKNVGNIVEGIAGNIVAGGSVKKGVSDTHTLKVKDISKYKGIIYTLQLGVYKGKKLPKKFDKLKVVFSSYTKNKSMRRVSYGILQSYKQAKEYKKRLKDRGFDCFITAYRDGKRIDVKEAIKLAEKSN